MALDECSSDENAKALQEERHPQCATQQRSDPSSLCKGETTDHEEND